MHVHEVDVESTQRIIDICLVSANHLLPQVIGDHPWTYHRRQQRACRKRSISGHHDRPVSARNHLGLEESKHLLRPADGTRTNNGERIRHT